jgi:hypothetical protein
MNFIFITNIYKFVSNSDEQAEKEKLCTAQKKVKYQVLIRICYFGQSFVEGEKSIHKDTYWKIHRLKTRPQHSQFDITSACIPKSQYRKTMQNK